MINKVMTKTNTPLPFQKITSAERAHFLKELGARLPDLVVSMAGDKPKRYKMTRVDSSQRVFVQTPVNLPTGEYLVNLGVDSGVYFLTAQLTPTPGGFLIDLAGDVFKFQRRGNFRCPIAGSSQAKVKVYSSPARQSLGEFRLKDLSGHGLAFYLPEQTNLMLWQPNSVFHVDVKVLDQNFQGLKMVLRHLHPEAPPWVGAELLELSFAQETDLSGVVLELQREWFRSREAG